MLEQAARRRHDGLIAPLHNAILLRRVWRRVMALHPLRRAVVTKLEGGELPTIVSA